MTLRLLRSLRLPPAACHVLLGLAACASARPAAAPACPAPPASGEGERLVARPAMPRPGGPQPAWPAAGVDGAEPGALLEFLVDTAGRVDPARPVRVVAASDSAAAAAARAALPQWRFVAAEVVPGCRVAQLVRLPFGRVSTP